MSITRRDALKLGGLAGILAAAGCSSGGGNSDTIAIANTDATDTLILQQLLTAQGYLNEFKVSASTVNVADGTKLMGSVIGNQSNLAVLTGFSQIFPAIEKGADLKIVGAVSLLPTDDIFTANPDIKTLKDLEGKSIATGAPGALLSELALAAFQKEGVDPNKVTFVDIGASNDAYQAVAAGKVDAGVAPSSFSTEDAKDHVRVIAELYSLLPEFTAQAAFAPATAIKNKGDALARTLAAYLKLFRYTSTPASRPAYLKAAAQVPGVTSANATALYEFYQQHDFFTQDLEITAERVDYIQRLNIASGIQQKVLPFDQVVDLSLARKAVQLLGGAT